MQFREGSICWQSWELHCGKLCCINWGAKNNNKIFDFLFHTDYYDIWILREAAIPAGFHSNLIPCRKNVISKRIGLLFLPEPTEAPWCSWWCMSTWYYKYTGWVKSFVWESSLKSTSNIKSLRQLFFFYQNFYKTKKEARLKNNCIKKVSKHHIHWIKEKAK